MSGRREEQARARWARREATREQHKRNETGAAPKSATNDKASRAATIKATIAAAWGAFSELRLLDQTDLIRERLTALGAAGAVVRIATYAEGERVPTFAHVPEQQRTDTASRTVN